MATSFLIAPSNLPSAEVSQPELMSIEYGPGERHRKGERRDEEAARYYEQALVIRREVGDRAGEGTTLGNLGMLAVSLGHVEEAIRYFEQALVIFTEIGMTDDKQAIQYQLNALRAGQAKPKRRHMRPFSRRGET